MPGQESAAEIWSSRYEPLFQKMSQISQHSGRIDRFVSSRMSRYQNL